MNTTKQQTWLNGKWEDFVFQGKNPLSDPMDEQFWTDQEQEDEDRFLSQLEQISLNEQAER